MTGSAGFIGSNFVRMLLEKDKSIKIASLDALTYAGNLSSLKDVLDSPRHEFVKGDIRDHLKVERLIKDCDLVFNFAAESHVDRSIHGPQIFLDANVNGCFTILEALRKSKKKIRFVQISTDEVYGTLGDTGQFTETSLLSPNSPYAASKASADLLTRSYFKTYGLDAIITRCANNYGPFQFPEKLIPLMIFRSGQGQKLPVYGDGLYVRDWIHVLDHCEGIWLAATNGKAGEIYNFGATNEWTNLQIVKQVLKLTGQSESLIEFVKDRPGHDRRYAVDSTKAQRDLNWKPKISFSEGLKKTVEWYQSNPKWLEEVTTGEYQKFYDSWYSHRKAG